MKVLILNIFLLLSTHLLAQSFFKNIRSDSFSVEFKKIMKTNNIDSAILINVDFFKYKENFFYGIGFINNKKFNVRLSYKLINDSVWCFSGFKKNKYKNIDLLSIGELNSLNNDSLSIKSRSNVYRHMDHITRWTLLTYQNNSLVLKQVDTPCIYQKIVFTEDRKEFLKVFRKINSEFECK